MLGDGQVWSWQRGFLPSTEVCCRSSKAARQAVLVRSGIKQQQPSVAHKLQEAAVVKSKSEGQASHSKQLIPSILFIYFHCGHYSSRNGNRSADAGIAWEGSRAKGQPGACRQWCGPSGRRPGDSCVGGCRRAVLVLCLCCAGSAYSLCAQHQQQLRE